MKCYWSKMYPKSKYSVLFKCRNALLLRFVLKFYDMHFLILKDINLSLELSLRCSLYRFAKCASSKWESVSFTVLSITPNWYCLFPSCLIIYWSPSVYHPFTNRPGNTPALIELCCFCCGIHFCVSDVAMNPERLKRARLASMLISACKDLYVYCLHVCVVCRVNADMVPLLSDPRVSLLTNGTVELSNVSYADSGEYICSVRNANISITANLEVFSESHMQFCVKQSAGKICEYKTSNVYSGVRCFPALNMPGLCSPVPSDRTVILTGPQDIRVVRGSSALLDCHFYRDPRLLDYQVVWKKDGHKLLESSSDDK